MCLLYAYNVFHGSSTHLNAVENGQSKGCQQTRIRAPQEACPPVPEEAPPSPNEACAPLLKKVSPIPEEACLPIPGSLPKASDYSSA